MDPTVRATTTALTNAIGLELVDFKMQRFSHNVAFANCPIFRRQLEVLERKVEDLKVVSQAWANLMAYRGQLLSETEMKRLNQEKDEILNMLNYLELRLLVRNDDIFLNDPCSSCTFSSAGSCSPTTISTVVRSTLQTLPSET